MAGTIDNMTKGQLRMFIRQVGRENFRYTFESDVELSVSGYIKNLEVGDSYTVTVPDGVTIVVLPDDPLLGRP